VEQIGGGKTSIVFTAKSSMITNIAGLKGKRFAAGNRSATSSGVKLPELLLTNGLHECDLQLKFHDHSEDNYKLVLEGKYDAAIGRIDKFTGNATNLFRVLAVLPTTKMPWAGRSGLNPLVQQAFSGAMTNLHDRKILAKLPDDANQGFRASDQFEFALQTGRLKTIVEQFFGTCNSSTNQVKGN
jgi:ABC-type phosphate/phosphonate transport system substrate-binding protein